MSKLSNPAVSKLPGPVCDMSAGLALMNPFRGRENWSFTSSPDAPTSSTAFSSANMALQALQTLQAIQACAESHCAEKSTKRNQINQVCTGWRVAYRQHICQIDVLCKRCSHSKGSGLRRIIINTIQTETGLVSISHHPITASNSSPSCAVQSNAAP